MEWFTTLPEHDLVTRHVGFPSSQQWPAGDPCPGDKDVLVFVYRNEVFNGDGSIGSTERS